MGNQDLVSVDRDGAVAVTRLNRPQVLNALSPQMLEAVSLTLETLDADPSISVMILTGDERAFAAGADIAAMSQLSPVEMLELNTRQYWQRLQRLKKPLIAAVSGYAYGGGCELAMQCDLIVASDTARFAQPEIKLGIMPGAGGTQRLLKAIGPYRAMEMILTGEAIDAQEAYKLGLVNRVVPVESYLEEAIQIAKLIASRPPVAVRLAREALRYGLETTMRDGIEVERRNFLLLFDSDDQKEGMKAFIEKRPAEFKGR